MKCRLAEQPAKFWSGAGIQQAKPDVFGPEARGADQRSFALAVLVKVEIRASLNERLDKRQFLAFLQGASEQHVRDVVERMREAFTPADELVRSRRILGEQSSECGRVPIIDCR